ncbi:MAG: ATP-dependent DNA ligase [Nitrospiria bacterium]
MKFSELVKYFERLEATPKRLEMFDILAELFRTADAHVIDKIIYLSQGQLVPSFQGLEMGMSEKLLLRALAGVTGHEPERVLGDFKRLGDLGKTAGELIRGKGRGLTITEVYEQFLSIAKTGGEGSVERKIQILQNLFLQASASEAKYIARFVVGRLRLGVGDAAVLEALSLARFGGREQRPRLERAYNLCSDLGLVGKVLVEKGEQGIDKIRVQVGYPIRMALCERLTSAEEIIEKIGPCEVEVKYDGFRLQVHKQGNEVNLFSRNLERTTPMFPEIEEAAKRQVAAREAIFEGEAIAHDESTGELHPFQITMQRKRKYDIDKIAKEFPLKFFAFDLLFADGRDYTDRPYIERREKLKDLIRPETVIVLSEARMIEKPKEMSQFFDQAVGRGLEGIIAKRLDAPYTAGARNFNWIKLKRSYKVELTDSLDVCIVGFYFGKGQRAQFGLGAVLVAVYDPENDLYKTISRIGTGFSEDELKELKKLLDPYKVSEKPPQVDSGAAPEVWVEPQVVVTVVADEITRSPFHTAGKPKYIQDSGYALRFPRIQGFVRTDKRPEDITTEQEVHDMFTRQRHVKLEPK